MIKNVLQFIESVQKGLSMWPQNERPWFRGESGNVSPLKPKVTSDKSDELYLLQTFRRKAGGLANTPPREGHTDLWLFLAQHYGIETRLIDWTEGALLALYFAVNRERDNPFVYMLNPYRLNNFTFERFGEYLEPPNFPLTWVKNQIGSKYISIAWSDKTTTDNRLDLPIAFPAAYQDYRMISQRSCFTIHGRFLTSLVTLLEENVGNITDYLISFQIYKDSCHQITKDLSILGITASTIYPDLDNLSKDINFEILH